MAADQRRPPWAQRLRQERARRGWTQQQAIDALRAAADAELPADDSMLRMWKRWEQGGSFPHRYRDVIAQALEVDAATIFGSTRAEPALVLPDTDPRRQGQADPTYVDELERRAGELIELDTTYGGDEVVPLAVRAFRSAYRRLASGLYVPAVERRLPAAVGHLAQVASWAAYDADQQSLARQLAHESLLASRLAGDRDMELFELGGLAMQSIHLRRPGEALRIVNDVLDNNRLSRRTEAMFHVRRGRALAQTGEHRRGLDALRQAAAMLSDGVAADDPSWTWWIDDSELAWHEAMSLADAGEWPRAVERFQLAYDLRPSNARRARFNDLAHLLDGQTAAGAWRDAEATLVAIIGQVDDVRSGRTTGLLERIVHAIRRDGPKAGTTTLVDAAEQLQQTLADGQ